MVSPSCFVSIPALPAVVTVSSTPFGAQLAYATTNTNYFGATSCGLSTMVPATPSSPQTPSSSVKCTIAPSISGKAYSVTPVIWVPRTVSSTLRMQPYDCDPIPAASINAGHWKFGCTSLLAKSMGFGFHTIDFVVPTGAGVSIAEFRFNVWPVTSTPKYVINTALATTTIVPTTIVPFTTSTSITRTLVASTTLLQIPTGTTTFMFTTTAPAAAVLVGTIKTLGGTPQPAPTTHLAIQEDLVAVGEDSSQLPALVDRDASEASELADNKYVDAARLALLRLAGRAAATPTIAHPDFTYPPYGASTVYVKSISTSICTHLIISASTVTPPVVTSIRFYRAYTCVTVTVTPSVV